MHDYMNRTFLARLSAFSALSDVLHEAQISGKAAYFLGFVGFMRKLVLPKWIDSVLIDCLPRPKYCFSRFGSASSNFEDKFLNRLGFMHVFHCG